MKRQSFKFKEENMLCDRCLMHVVKSLSMLENIEEINVSLETKRVEVKYNDKNISKEDIKYIVEQSILTGKIVKLEH